MSPGESGLPWVWRRLGGSLPASIRELVFEPVCHEVLRKTALAGYRAGWRVHLHLSWCFLASFWYAAPRYVVQGGKLTKPARVAGAFVVIGSVILLVLLPWMLRLSGLYRAT